MYEPWNKDLKMNQELYAKYILCEKMRDGQKQ